MEPLNLEKSWELFLETILGCNKSDLPKQLGKGGRNMLKQCGGRPLVIKEMARQLSEKRRSAGSEWEQLLQPNSAAILEAIVSPIVQLLQNSPVILEAIVSPIVQKLDSRREWEVKEVTDDLRMTVAFVRDKNLGEGSLLYHWICDFVYMARDLVEKRNISEVDVKPVRNWTREIKRCILEFDGGLPHRTRKFRRWRWRRRCGRAEGGRGNASS